MPALILYGILPILGLFGVLAPALDSLPAPDTCAESGLQCAITVGHLFSY